MDWKFYRKVVKIKSQKILGTNFYVCWSYEEKLVGEPFCPRTPPHPLSWIGSMSVRETIQYQVFIRYCILFGSICIIRAYLKYTYILKTCIRRNAERNKKWTKAIKKGKETDNNSSHIKKRVRTFNLEAAVNIKITPSGNVLKMYSGKQKPWYLFVSAITGQNKKKKYNEEYSTKISVMLLCST